MKTPAPVSDATYWIEVVGTGVWRVARSHHACCIKGCSGIKPGSRYLDTGERQLGRQWATVKECEAHATGVPS